MTVYKTTQADVFLYLPSRYTVNILNLNPVQLHLLVECGIECLFQRCCFKAMYKTSQKANIADQYKELRVSCRDTGKLKIYVYYIYSTAKETRKFVTLKLIKDKLCWIQEIYITCKTNCIVLICLIQEIYITRKTNCILHVRVGRITLRNWLN